MHSRGILFLLSSLAAGLLYGQLPAQHRALISEGETQIQGAPIYSVPRWKGSRLVGCDQCQSRGPILWTVDRQGRREEIVFEVPESGYISAWDIASGPDGALAVVGYAMSNDSRLADFVAWISPDRKRQIITRVWPYHPYAVTVAPDGTIWTVGPVKHEDSTVDLHANVLRHYDPSGRLLATVTVRGTRRYNGLARVAPASALMASNDRIGWLTNACEYIEFSFSAVEMGRYTCPNGILDGQTVGGVALSSANDLVVGGRRSGPLAPLELDRATRTWIPVPAPAGFHNVYGILGFDVLTLVTYPEAFKLARLNWGDAPPAAQ